MVVEAIELASVRNTGFGLVQGCQCLTVLLVEGAKLRDVCADIHLVAKVNENLDNHVDCNIVVFTYSMGLDEWVDANKVSFIMSDQCFEFVSQFSHDWIAPLVELHELAAV